MDEIEINPKVKDVKTPEIPIPQEIPTTKIIKVRDWDDKDLIIMAVTIIGVISLFILPDPAIILTSILSGLFGMATGSKLK